MPSTLRIMAWKSNGLLRHKESLLMTMIGHKIDVSYLRCTLSENHTLNCEDLRFTTPYIPATAPREEVMSLSKLTSHNEDVKSEKDEYQVTSVKDQIWYTSTHGSSHLLSAQTQLKNEGLSHPPTQLHWKVYHRRFQLQEHLLWLSANKRKRQRALPSHQRK